VRARAWYDRGTAEAIRLQHGVERAELTSIYLDRPPKVARSCFARLATLAVRNRIA
jgi:hypothetical protein